MPSRSVRCVIRSWTEQGRAGAVVAAALGMLLLGSPAQAQVFLASQAAPPFTISPLFVTLRVTRQPDKASLDVFWSLSARRAQTISPGDLFLLLPFAVTGPPGSPADADLVRHVETRGFAVKDRGSLPLVGVEQRAMGTGERKQLGTAPFVTYDAPLRQGRSRPATYIRVPWTSSLADPEWLVGLSMGVPALVTPKPASWIENAFWGQRQVASAGFGDLGYVALYRLYYEHRDHVAQLGRDYSLLRVSFDDAHHLRVDHLVPATAKRGGSETRAGVEVISVPLTGGGIVPQALRVEYAYANNWQAWQPVLVSLLFVIIGNATGPLVTPVLRKVARSLAARFDVGTASPRQSGVILAPDTLARLKTGETSYDDVMRLCGGDCEEHEQFARDSHRVLVYRGRRVVPQRRWRLWKLATVSRWDVEHHEVDIELQDGLVANVQARVRRAKWAPAESA